MKKVMGEMKGKGGEERKDRNEGNNKNVILRRRWVNARH